MFSLLKPQTAAAEEEVKETDKKRSHATKLGHSFKLQIENDSEKPPKQKVNGLTN
jgi:phosphoribosylformylglycinamidine (FGAM) synthase PurS component